MVTSNSAKHIPQSADHITVLLEQIVVFLAESKISYEQRSQQMETKLDDITTSVNQQLFALNESINRLDHRIGQTKKNLDSKRGEMILRLFSRRVDERFKRLQDTIKDILTRCARICSYTNQMTYVSRRQQFESLMMAV
jgi:hypothetical protein